MARDDLYLIQMAITGAFKVGRSNDTKRRLGELQTGCPHPLRILLVAEGLGYLEKSVHRALAPYQTRYGKGEWFREEGMGCIPDRIWSLVPADILEDPDWWKSGSFAQQRSLVVVKDHRKTPTNLDDQATGRREGEEVACDLDTWFGLNEP
jgi:hypothetical protein